MLFVSTIIGKLTFILLRLFGRSGSALPGLIVEKFDDKFLQRSLAQLPNGFVVVSGTNGKTTTTKILAELLEAHGLCVVTNATGSNFVRGIIGALLKSSTISGKLPYDIAIFEQDEAHAVQLVNRVRPNGVVLLNVMRDQMDRFGEIDTTAKLLAKVAEKASDFVVLNANDPRIAKIADQVAADQTSWFGHSSSLLEVFGDDDQHHNNKRSRRHFEAAKPNVTLTGIGSHEITMEIQGQSYKAEVQLAGTHNALNVVAALSALAAIKPEAPLPVTFQALASIQPAFGRGEQLSLKDGSFLQLQLVKNPAGFTHALRQLADQPYVVAGIAINDNDADGRDVSWLWDVDFSAVPSGLPVFCGGIRAYDMAVRLKYDNTIAAGIETDMKQFLTMLRRDNAPGTRIMLFCTYTAMLEIRRLLKHDATDMEAGL